MLIIGHRGAAGLAPENTLESFAAAIEAGVDMIELDVQLARGKEPVVTHDCWLERLTGQKGYVESFTRAQLGKLGIPTLAEALEFIDERTQVNIELKARWSGDAVADLLAHYMDSRWWRPEQLLVSSGAPRELSAFRGHRLGIPVGLIIDQWWDKLKLRRIDLRFKSVHLSHRLAKPGFIRRIRAFGLRPYIYTINDPDEAARLKQIGAAGIFTDYPDRFKQI